MSRTAAWPWRPAVIGRIRSGSDAGRTGNGWPEFVPLRRTVVRHLDGVDDDGSSAPLPKRSPDGQYEHVNVEIKAGTPVLMHGNLRHTSAANQSSKTRMPFSFGVVVEGEYESFGSRTTICSCMIGEAEFGRLDFHVRG